MRRTVVALRENVGLLDEAGRDPAELVFRLAATAAVLLEED